MHFEGQEVDLKFVFLALIDHSAALLDCLAGRFEVTKLKPSIGGYKPEFLQDGLSQLSFIRNEINEPFDTSEQTLDERITAGGLSDDLVETFNHTGSQRTHQRTELLLGLHRLLYTVGGPAALECLQDRVGLAADLLKVNCKCVIFDDEDSVGFQDLEGQ